MNIIEQYETYVAAGDWPAALSTVQEIVRQSPQIATSWFNLGVCSDALGKHQDAATAFNKAFQLDPQDYGAVYRAFRSLTLARDSLGFFTLLESIVQALPEITEMLNEREEFQIMTKDNRFRRFLP